MPMSERREAATTPTPEMDHGAGPSTGADT